MIGTRHGARRLHLAAALVAVALAACSSPEEKRAEHVSRSEAYLAEGKISEALIELRRALKLDPQSGDLNFRIGEVLESVGELPDALFFYQEAVRLAPADGKAALAAGRLLIFVDPDRAEQLIAGVLERTPSDPVAYLRRSELALVRANTLDALADARTAVELAPGSHMAHFQEGIVHRARIRERQLLREEDDPKVFVDALAAFDKGLEVAGKDAPVHEVVRGAIERAFVLASWKQRAGEAPDAFRRAVEIARERGSVPEQIRVLGEARSYAEKVRDEGLERWALEAELALEPQRYAAWMRLAALTKDESVPKRLLETLPDDESAHAIYARILRERGREEEAVAHLREVESRLGDPVPIRRTLVEFLVDAMRFDEARALVESLSQEHPDRPETFDAVSLLAMREGRYADAVAAVEKLVERRESPLALMRLAEARYRLGNTAAALVAVNRGLELIPEEAGRVAMLRLKGRIEITSGDNEAGIQTFQRVRRQVGGIPGEDATILAGAFYATKRDAAARALLGEAVTRDDAPLEAVLLYLQHESAREPARAREVLERAAARYPDRPVLVAYLVRMDLASGQAARAEQRVLDSLAAYPNYAGLHRLHARVLIANGKREEALAAAEKALEFGPELSGVTELVVSLLSELGRRDEAIARLETEAKAGRLGVARRVLLARLQIVAGQDARATELLEGVVAERSDLPGAKNDLAFLLARQGGDLERARQLAEEARTALPRSPDVADTLGYVYLQKGLSEAARDQFRAALDLSDPQSSAWATSQYHLGLSYKALGRMDEAREAFERALATAVDFPEATEARRQIQELASTSGPS